MIIEFKAVDLTTFKGTFNGHLLMIIKQPNGDWKLYVDYVSGKNCVKPSARACMDMAEKAAGTILSKQIVRRKG